MTRFPTAIFALILGISVAAELSALGFMLPLLGAMGPERAAVYVSVLEAYANTARTEAGLSPLADNALLIKAAKQKAEDMAAKGYFSHTSPNGSEPWDFIRAVGYDYRAAGENLAVNFSDSRILHDAWMNSPGHRDNILRGEFTEIGIGSAAGEYKGKPALFVAVMFGSPSNSNSAVSETPVTYMPQPASFITASALNSPSGISLSPLAASPIAAANSMLALSAVTALLLIAYLAYHQTVSRRAAIALSAITVCGMGTIVAFNMYAASGAGLIA